LSALDFLRDIGKHFRVNRMLAKEAVSARLDSQDGISYTEFSYQILQGMDFLELYRKHGCVLQLGGSDQWGNLTAGVDLIHRVEQVPVHALTTTLITKSDGTKYGKTEGGGTVWLDPEMMSPYAFYQFWLNAEDAQVGRLLRVFTFRSREEIEALEEATRERPQAREGQRALAADVTTLVHGERATAQAIAASQALFGRGTLEALDERTLRDATAELARATVNVGTPVVDAFVAAGLAPSRSGARRTITEGGAYVNNTKVDDVDAVFAADHLLHGRYVVLRRGRKALAAGVVGES
jgi:tyrosyl-tRNA synthetase